MKIVIFDMDGTLIDSQHDITISINHVRAEAYGLEPLGSDYVVEAINRYQRNLPKLFYNTEIYETHARELFEAHYFNQCIQSPRLYDGIRTLLKTLQDAKIHLAVATNAPSTFARRMLEHLEIAHYFSYIVGADMVNNPKPHADMLRYSLERFGYHSSKDSAWMIGDNSKDVEAAQNANICSVFATWGFSNEGEGDYVLSHPKHLLPLVN